MHKVKGAANRFLYMREFLGSKFKSIFKFEDRTIYFKGNMNICFLFLNKSGMTQEPVAHNYRFSGVLIKNQLTIIST